VSEAEDSQIDHIAGPPGEPRKVGQQRGSVRPSPDPTGGSLERT
jgi:hypothetical protein